MPVLRPLLFSTLLLTLVPRQVTATTMPPLTLSELHYVADAVIEGTVLSVQPEAIAGREGVQTLVRLRADQVWKGDALEGDLLRVREWGGVLPNQRTDVAAGAVYAPGERVLVFLEADRKEPGGYRTLAMSLGKWTIVRELGSGRDVALKVAIPHGLHWFDENQVRVPVAPTYLDELHAQVEEERRTAYVPPYTVVPGLPAWKDLRYAEDAARFGHPVSELAAERARARVAAEGRGR